jgi:hypothetical protein
MALIEIIVRERCAEDLFDELVHQFAAAPMRKQNLGVLRDGDGAAQREFVLSCHVSASSCAVLSCQKLTL